MYDELEKELLDMNLSGMNADTQPKHPKSMEIVKKISEMLIDVGIPFKLYSHLVDSLLYIYSDLKNDEVFIATIIFCVWGFIADDHLEHNPQDFSKWYNILEGEECVENGHLEKMYRLFLKAANTAFTKSLDELLCMAKSWFESSEKMLLLCRGETQLSEKEFLEVRFENIGAIAAFFFIKIDVGLDVTKELASDTNWDKLTYYAAFHLICVNDSVSLKKEVKAGQGNSNYVYVKMRNNNISAQEAVQQILIETDNHGQKLKQSFNIDGLEAYVDGLIIAIVGHQYWANQSVILILE